MKMTNNEAYEALNLLVRLREKGRLGFVIAKNIRILRGEISEYISLRDKFIQEAGTRKGDAYVIENPENIQKFMDLISEYDSISFEFTPQTIDEETFCSGGLTSDQMYALDWMVKE
ncbi:MAG: hypothetical protein IJV40_06285 [Oscillospiraceae bacterium]|nr:hypothetical protein [Oscillospiraceae bacterium]